MTTHPTRPERPRVTAILTPSSEDKADRLEEVLKSHAAHVEENEPGTLVYEMQRVPPSASDNGSKAGTKFIVWEVYADEAAQRANNSSPQMKELMETLKREALVADWGVAYEGKLVGGFTR